MKLRKAAAAVAVAVALSGLAGQARADAFGGAFIDITDFVITGGDAVLPVSALDPTTLSFTDTLVNTASLNGVFDAGFAASVGFVQAVDARQACVQMVGGAPVPGPASCVAPENFFDIVDEPPPETTPVFSRSDSLVAGSPLAGAVDPLGNPIPTGVHAGTVAEVSISQPLVFGSGESDIGLASTFQFVADQDIGEINIEFNADTFLQAWTGPGTVAPTLATAANNWILTLTAAGSTDPIIFWAPGSGAPAVGLDVESEPCDLNEATSAGPNSPNDPVVDCSGFFQAFSTVGLTAGTTYSFTIQHGSLATALQAEQAVPEPSSLLLLGLGLAGLGFARRYIKAA